MTDKVIPAIPQLFAGLSCESKEELSSATLVLFLSQSRGWNEAQDESSWETVLQFGAERIRSSLRGEDRCFNTSVQEIVVELHSIGPRANIQVIAERLLELVQRTYVVGGQMMYLNAHLGIAVSPEDGIDAEVLLSRASIALRQSRRSEAGTATFFSLVLEQKSVIQNSLTNALRKALLLRQMEVHYQPQVDLSTRRLIGCEALLRWTHPELGSVSPAEFIPLAEEIGMISTLGAWVLRTACVEAMRFPEWVTVAVNVSPIQLKNGTLLEAIHRALAVSHLPPSRLEIELTEGVLLEPSISIRSTLETIHQMGIRLAIDDFGTGYSSLSQLIKLPFNTIKIDRSLVGVDEKSRAIVRAIAMLGSGLKMGTLIEGIETVEQLADAQDAGCTFAQGYLFGKAVPAGQLGEAFQSLSFF